MSFAKYPVSGGAGSSTVTGPATSTNNGVVLFNGTTGNVVKDLGVGTFGQVLVTDGVTPSFAKIGVANIDSPNQLVTTSSQTYTGLKTFASGIDFSGGASANFTIWSASNVLRLRGGTSGIAIDNTFSANILSATDAGAFTVGNNLFSGEHNIFGSVVVDHSNDAVAGNRSIIFRNAASRNAYIRADFNSSGTGNGTALAFGTNNNGADGVDAIKIDITGAATIGPTGFTGAHTFNGRIGGTLEVPPTVNYTSNGSIQKVGAHALTITTTATSSVTFPTSGTLATTSLKLNAFTSTTSAELASVISDETGLGTTGKLVFNDGPTFTGTPVLPATFTIGANSFQRSGAHSLTLTTTGNSNITLPLGTATLTSTSDKLSAFAATTSAELAGVISDETGSGKLVFADAPTFNGLTLGGGSAANLSLWSASNILNLRGGTSGLDIYNTSGTVVVDVTDAGAVTLGPSSGFAGQHILQSTSSESAIIKRISTSAANAIGLIFNNDATDSATNYSILYGFGGSARTLAFQFQATGGAGNVGTITPTGSWTLGPSSGLNAAHSIQADSPTNGNILNVRGTGTTGTYLNIEENGTRIASMGFDNGSSTFKFRTGVTSGSGNEEIGSFTSTGSWTLGPSAGLTSPHVIQKNHADSATAVYSQAFLKLKMTSTVNNTGVCAITLPLSTTENYGFSLSSVRTTTGAAGDLQFRIHDNSDVGVVIGKATSLGAWTIGATSGTQTHILNGLLNFDSNQGTNASYALTMRKDATGTGADVNYFMSFGVAGTYSNSGRISSNGANACNFFGTSDRRLKEDIHPLNDGLNKINQLNPVHYRWKESGVSEVGFIAQEVHKVLPHVVGVKDDGLGDELLPGQEPWTMTDGGPKGFLPYLVKAIQELSTKLDSMELKIKQLEGK